MKPRIIVCGLARTGLQIYTLLKRQGASVVGISNHPVVHQDSDEIILGDLRSNITLIKAGIKEAQTLVLANNDDSLNLAILTQARLLNPQIRIINRLSNQTLATRLDQILPAHLSMSVSALAAPIFAFAALGNKAIGQLNLYNQTWPIYEVVITPTHPWLDLKLSELWDNPYRMLIYYLPSKGEIDLVSAVTNDSCLKIGDHLIVGNQPNIQSKRAYTIKKFIKAIFNLRRYQEYGRPVAIVTLSLLITILFATFTYVSSNWDTTSIIDALYFSVGMITGAGGQEQVAESGSNSIKIFTAVMMIVGAGVIGICYALINDFILGSRIKQFWDAARVPGRNHYVVCGLGGIGIEIVRQLSNQGHEVVVIESDPNNRFLHTARSLGIPILLEDASLTASLKTANVDRAQALLAVTSNDMMNVEIGLTAKAVNPNLHVTVRCHDGQLAQGVQEVFEFDSVLSPTELATPSFAAAALGGRILGNGMTDDLLWIALATMITPGHPFCNKTIKQAATEANFVPLYVERNSKTIHSWQLLETCLQSKDVLYLTMPATALEQLWHTNSYPINI